MLLRPPRFTTDNPRAAPRFALIDRRTGLDARGFALDFMAEGHRISMLTLEAVEGDPFEAPENR